MIELKNVSICYENKNIINNLSAAFGSGEFTCIIGKNGSGKSTLLRAMDGIQSYKGQILLDNIEIMELSRKERAKKIAYLPQIRQIPDIEVQTLISHGRFPHLGFSRTMSKEDIDMVFYAAELTSVQNVLHHHVAELSGGERQRVYLAMVIAQDADTILLDEPTTYMDINHQIEIMKILSKLNKNGKNIIMVAHDLPQAFTYGSEIKILHNGTIAEAGRPLSLCKNTKLESIFGFTLEKSQSAAELYQYHLIIPAASLGDWH